MNALSCLSFCYVVLITFKFTRIYPNSWTVEVLKEAQDAKKEL
jgi:hypothetical protein